MKKFTNWKHQQIIIQLTHSVLFYSAANWHIGTLINWHIIYSISPEKLIDSLFCILTLILAEPLE